jgi:hypothetical protein
MAGHSHWLLTAPCFARKQDATRPLSPECDRALVGRARACSGRDPVVRRRAIGSGLAPASVEAQHRRRERWFRCGGAVSRGACRLPARGDRRDSIAIDRTDRTSESSNSELVGLKVDREPSLGIVSSSGEVRWTRASTETERFSRSWRTSTCRRRCLRSPAPQSPVGFSCGGSGRTEAPRRALGRLEAKRLHRALVGETLGEREHLDEQARGDRRAALALLVAPGEVLVADEPIAVLGERHIDRVLREQGRAPRRVKRSSAADPPPQASLSTFQLPSRRGVSGS